MGWLITLGVLILLAVLPLGIRASYDEDGPLVLLIVGPLKYTLIPGKKKEKKPKKTRTADAENSSDEPAAEKSGSTAMETDEKSAPGQKKKSGGSLKDFDPLIRVILKMLDVFKRRLRVNLLRLKVVLAADDPYDVAVNYGRAWAAIGNLLPRLERAFVIKKRDIDVECDFTATQTLITARLDLTITLGRLLATAAVHGFNVFREYSKISKKRKGGASQ